MSISVCKSPIDIITKTAKNDPSGIQFNYNAGDCNSVKGSNNGISFIKLTYEPESKNTVIYKNNTYSLIDIRLYKNSLHTINGKFSAGELVLTHICKKPELVLNICIPISLTTDIKKSSFGAILAKLPSKVHSFQSPKKFIPTTTYYSYTGTDLFACKTAVEYIVFETSSINITLNEFNGIPNNTIKRSNNTGVAIYSHNKQSSAGSISTSKEKHISFGDDNVYIDCQPINSPNVSTKLNETPPPPINFSNLQDNKFVQMLLMFIIIMIVMVIFFYSYEFTTGMFRELTKSVAKMNQL